jgi:hypothetical protein
MRPPGCCYTATVLLSDTLIVNPLAELKMTRDGDQVTAITVLAPVKGRHLHMTTVNRTEDPELFGLLLLHSITNGAGGSSGFSGDERTRLANIGFLIPEDRTSTRPWFSCDLDDLPAEFLPRNARHQPTASAIDDLVVNPTLRLFGRDGFPQAMRGRLNLTNRFNPDRSWLWVDTGDLSGPSIYSYSSAVADAVGQLRPGESLSSSLGPELRQNLFAAGVIGSSAAMARRREARSAQAATLGLLLRQRGYIVLPQLIPPLQVAATRRYYRELIDEGFLSPGDKDRPDRDSSGRDSVAHFYHHQLTDLVAEILAEPVKASFCFFAAYHRGSQLKPHRDRPQCEYAVSIQLDFSPDPESASPWALHAEPLDGSPAEPIELPLGGALMYLGCRVRHYRDVLTQGDQSRHWFVFYVPMTFTEPLD